MPTKKKTTTQKKLTIKEPKLKFNTKEDLDKFIGDEVKSQIIWHPAKIKKIAGAKDTGKTYIVKVKELWDMERNELASNIAMRKYSNSASKMLGASFSKAYNHLLRAGYKFDYEYIQASDVMRRLKYKSNLTRNQAQYYLSFETIDKIAGFDIANGGYPANVHIEEIIQANDLGNTPERDEWNAQVDIISDSIKRLTKDYSRIYGNNDASTTWWYTFNMWDPTHPEQEDMEYFIPEDQYLDWMLGFEAHKQLNWKNPNSPETIQMNKLVLDPIWDKVKKSMLSNHTQIKYVEYDKRGGLNKYVDTLYVRMSKFANPARRNDKDDVYKITNKVYNALISGNRYELAVTLGLESDPDQTMETVHRFLDLKQDIKIREYMQENQFLPKAVALCWDIDVNRRLVCNPVILAERRVIDNPILGTYTDSEWKCFIDKPRVIKAYGRNDYVTNPKNYETKIKENTLQLMDELKVEFPSIRSFAGSMDDTATTMVRGLLEIKDRFDMLLQQTKRHGDWDLRKRQAFWQTAIDNEFIIIDKENLDMLWFLETVKKDSNGKRIEKGKYEKAADFVNSAEGGLFFFRDKLFANM